MLRLRDAFGSVNLIDARSSHSQAEEAASKFDLDQGMAAWINDRWYHGAECMNILSLASGPSPFVNRIIGGIFANPDRARRFYPFLRTGRFVTLALLGRGRIGKRNIG